MKKVGQATPSDRQDQWHMGELYGMSEMHRRKGSDRFKGRISSVLNGFGSVSTHNPRQRH